MSKIAMFKAFLTAALVFGLAAMFNAQVLSPVKWSFSVEQSGAKSYLVYSATIQEGWTVYSQYLDNDDGPVATEISFDNLNGAKLVGKAVESGGKISGFDDIFKMNVTKFKNSYVIRQEVSGFRDKPIIGYLTYMTCDKLQCLPPSDVEFSLEAPKAPTSEGNIKTKLASSPSISLDPNLATPGKDVPTKAPSLPNKPKSATPLPVPINKPSSEVSVVDGNSEPVNWSFSVRQKSDKIYVLTARASIAEGWNIYSQEVEAGGPIPTSFYFEPNANYTLVGKVNEIGKRKSGLDPVFKVQVAKLLAPEAVFEQEVELLSPDAQITGYLEFMSCDQTQCLPPRDVNFTFVPGQGLAQEGTLSQNPPSAVVPSADPLSAYQIDKSGQAATCGNTAGASSHLGSDDGLWKVFLLGAGGGLLALLTPCVFPMIPLTVSFFTSRGKDRKRGLRRASIYGLSIIAIYVALGLLVTGIFGADALNAFSTNPWVNIGFGVLFIIFALSFFGLFEIALPNSWANKTDRAADQGGLLGIFFMAFTLSLVSFSCTGPIIGTLLVETASGGGRTLFGHLPVAPLVGMLGFSTALALPFTLFAAFPSALASLPKSGGWMETVKVTLGIAEVAFAMKFLSTADLILGTKWMPYELFLGVWVLCAAALALYYLGFFSKSSGRKQWSASRVLLGLGSVGIMVYLSSGYRYDAISSTFDTPSALSGLAPPAGHSYVYPKECPRDFNCFKDYDMGMAYARQVGKPVLLDFTGHGCVNCRRMEDQVWGQPGVYERIKKDFVLISLYVDEREELAEPFVSEFSGRKLRTVGNKWADFQARIFDRNSQPYYVLLSPDEKVLNQPVPYTPDVEEYAAFLNCGLSRFREESKKEKGAVGDLGEIK